MPFWFIPLFLYLLLGGYIALKRRVVFLPVAASIPLFLLALQVPLILSLTHEQQLMALGALLAGLGAGGTVWRFSLIKSIDALRFEVAGERLTLGLVCFIFAVKTAAGWYGASVPAAAFWCQLISALAGCFVPGVFLGRALFLIAHVRPAA